MSAPPTPPKSPSSRLLRYLLWASELGLVLAVLYALANRPPKAHQPGASATPAVQASPAAPPSPVRP